MCNKIESLAYKQLRDADVYTEYELETLCGEGWKFSELLANAIADGRIEDDEDE